MEQKAWIDKQLWVGGSLRAHWEDWLCQRIKDSPQGGRIVVATVEQKRVLKGWALRQLGGLLGWSIMTRAQEEQRTRALGEWELAAIARLILPQNRWAETNLWARTLVGWMRAGYSPGQIPWREPKIWAQLTDTILQRCTHYRQRLVWEVGWEGDIAIGFDPLEVWGATPDITLGLITGTPVTGAQMTAVERLEKAWGEACYVDTTPSPNRQAIQVNAPDELAEGLKQILVENKPIEHIVYLGSRAKAAAVRIASQLEGQITLTGGGNWTLDDLLDLYIQAHEEPNFTSRLQLMRAYVAHGILEEQALRDVEEDAREIWEKTGSLNGIPEESMGALWSPLPPSATAAEYRAAMPAPLQPAAELLQERLYPLYRWLGEDKRLSRELWLELLRNSGAAHPSYTPLLAVPPEHATGLIDAQTVVIYSEEPTAPPPPLVDIAQARALNEKNYGEGRTPTHGYIPLDHQAQQQRLYQEAAAVCSWVGLKNDSLPKGGIPWRAVRYSYTPARNTAQQPLQAHHATRLNTQAKFGPSDYALPTPMRASCKQWEGIATSPELAWYQMLKLEPLWGGQAQPPTALWIGNWVHTALGNPQVDTTAIDNFFVAQLQQASDASLVWRQALWQAWKIARGCGYALEKSQAQTVQVERNIAGVLDITGQQIPLRGRIDRTVVLPPDPTLIVIDWKTGSSIDKLRLRALEVEGDGLQLWLYGRLLAKEHPGPIALCRVKPEAKIEPQLPLTPEAIAPENIIAHIHRSGVLGHSSHTWGRYGPSDRLPLAAWPLNPKIIRARRRATYD